MRKHELLKGAVDCHCHLSDPRISADIEAMLVRAREAGVANFALAGVGPEDWQAQERFAQAHPGVLSCFGLHPYFVAANSQENCETALRELAACLDRSLGLGECGLDFRAEILGKEGEAGEARQEGF